MFPFLVKAVAISLSGVMAPGPMTVATMVAGTRRRHAVARIVTDLFRRQELLNPPVTQAQHVQDHAEAT